MIPAKDLRHSVTPFADAAVIIWGSGARYWVSAGVAIAAFGALNGYILVQGQVPYAIAKDKLFPPVFGKKNKRGVPVLGISTGSVLVSALMVMNYTKGLADQFKILILLSTLTVLVPYLFSSAAYLIIKLENKFQAEDFEACSIEFLIDHIMNKHHKISRENAVIIHDLAQVVAYEDGRISPETKELVSSLFLCLHDYLNILKKEEEILFPNICLSIRNNAKSERGQYPTFGFINHWIKEIKQDHETMAEYFRVFYKITNDYLLPGDASSSHRALFGKLREFEMDFILHSYFENNILFPRTIGEDEHCSEEK